MIVVVHLYTHAMAPSEQPTQRSYESSRANAVLRAGVIRPPVKEDVLRCYSGRFGGEGDLLGESNGILQLGERVAQDPSGGPPPPQTPPGPAPETSHAPPESAPAAQRNRSHSLVASDDSALQGPLEAPPARPNAAPSASPRAPSKPSAALKTVLPPWPVRGSSLQGFGDFLTPGDDSSIPRSCNDDSSTP